MALGQPVAYQSQWLARHGEVPSRQLAPQAVKVVPPVQRGGVERNSVTRYSSASSSATGTADDVAARQQGSPFGIFDEVEELPSSKVSEIASEIIALETRCNWLDSRNQWLYSKILQKKKNRSSYIKKSMMMAGVNGAKACFNAWHSAMDQFRSEHQLEDNTAALDLLQSTIRELVAAVNDQKEAKRRVDAEYEQVLAAVDELQAENETLADHLNMDERRMEAVTKRLEHAEGALGQSKQDAQELLERHAVYDKKKKQVDLDMKAQLGEAGKAATYAAPKSSQLRNGDVASKQQARVPAARPPVAQNIDQRQLMQSVDGMLNKTGSKSRFREPSPESAPERTRAPYPLKAKPRNLQAPEITTTYGAPGGSYSPPAGSYSPQQMPAKPMQMGFAPGLQMNGFMSPPLPSSPNMQVPVGPALPGGTPPPLPPGAPPGAVMEQWWCLRRT
eukprot:gnl/TRDRNA2_/TRDRNA2_94525_c0_seq1.p1 gnl/TRDRNA2_/TRDRNA2_94525_c0~~gnl/TRDRNA2_/TRDRNA2_94525_c0_seq1.p1  ORF type:complete len:447 (-),score=104.05 gnl/TRDRNA2_/TRDRNA2_94525_c0_seq1:145-1485(-)